MAIDAGAFHQPATDDLPWCTGWGSRTPPWRQVARHRLTITGAVVLVLLALAALLAPLIAPYPPNPLLSPDVLAQAHQSPSWHHLFGTDALGRDVFSRTLWGGRFSLLIGLTVAAASTVIGIAVGAVAGWCGGRLEEVLMRLTDLVLVLPGLALLMIAQKGLGGSMAVIVATLSLLSWHTMARVVRAQFRSLKHREFVEAARATGASSWRIVVRQLLPNTFGVIAVNATLAISTAILTESALSFLGFGIQPPDASWGTMLADARASVGTRTAYLVYFPGLAILVTVVAVNMIGDGLRDCLDPTRSEERPLRLRRSAGRRDPVAPSEAAVSGAGPSSAAGRSGTPSRP